MDVTFTRTGETTYMTEVHRADNVVLSVPAAGASARMPHDLVHLVVEQHLGMDQGFWGCIAAGAEMRGMAVLSGRRRPHAKERSSSVLKAAGQRLTESEHMVTLFLDLALSRLDLRNPERARSRINNSWHAHDRPQYSVDCQQVCRVCAGLRSVRDRWIALEIGASITLDWPEAEAAKRRYRQQEKSA